MRWSVPASIRSGPPRDVPAPSIASASRAGHPSVSRVRRVAVSAGSRSPSSRPSPTASRSSIASSAGPISSNEPSARQRANGRRIRARPAIGHLRPFGQVLDELRKDVEARPRGDPVRVVDGDPDRLRGSGHRCQQSPDHGPVRHRVRCDRAEELRTERYAAVDRRREIGQEHDRDRCHCRRPSARRPARTSSVAHWTRRLDLP